jgi:hypothetical protein
MTWPKTTCFPSSHGVLAVHRKNWDPLVCGPACFCVGLLGEIGFERDLYVEFLRQRFYRLNAAQTIGGVNGRHPECHELGHQRFRLRAAFGVQRTVPVVAGVAILATGGAVPDDHHRSGVHRALGEPGDQFAVMGVGESFGCVGRREPQQLIDFVTGHEFTALAAGRPVVNDLGAARDRVPHRSQAPSQMRALAGLFEDLPRGRHGFDLAGIEFALG